MKDYYKILGLKETASADEIHDRWIELIQKFHPDHGILGEMDEEKAKEINEAYQVLKYSSTRMEYDFERLEQKRLKKFPIPKFIIPVSGLTFLFILSFMFLKKPQVPTSLNPKPHLAPPSQTELSSIPQYEPGPYVSPTQDGSKMEKSTKVEKVEKAVTKQISSGTKIAPAIPKKKPDPLLQTVHPDAVKSLSVSPPEELSHPASIDSERDVKIPGPPEKISVVRHISIPSPSIKVEDQVAELKSPPLIATDEEVKRFFAEYVERYNQKDIGRFISLFSSKAIQNQKDGLEGVRRIYDNFFNQSQELRYRLNDTRIEIYQNAVEIKARYEIDQILKKEGEEKIWRGQVQWVLVKEEGVLKITSLNYQHDKSP
jgi:hypothetical protein